MNGGILKFAQARECYVGYYFSCNFDQLADRLGVQIFVAILMRWTTFMIDSEYSLQAHSFWAQSRHRHQNRVCRRSPCQIIFILVNITLPTEKNGDFWPIVVITMRHYTCWYRLGSGEKIKARHLLNCVVSGHNEYVPIHTPKSRICLKSALTNEIAEARCWILRSRHVTKAAATDTPMTHSHITDFITF